MAQFPDGAEPEGPDVRKDVRTGRPEEHDTDVLSLRACAEGK